MKRRDEETSNPNDRKTEQKCIYSGTIHSFYIMYHQQLNFFAWNF